VHYGYFHQFPVLIGEYLGQKSEKEQPGNQEAQKRQENGLRHPVAVPDAA
jgi:hypothetical protein